MRNRRIAVLGLPYFGTKTARSLRAAGFDARFVPFPGRSPRKWLNAVVQVFRADAVYAIGSSARVHGPLDLIRRTRKPVLMHWVGSDVLAAQTDVRERRFSAALRKSAVHRADAEWLVDELARIGVKAQVRSLPIAIAIGSPAPLPPEFSVLVYLPRVPQEAYDVEAVTTVMKALPGVRFVVVGGYQPRDPLPNVEVAGYTKDMPAAFRNCAVFLRLMKHDGMAHSIIESLSFGRYAIWSFPFDGAIHVESVDEAIGEIARLHGLFGRNELAPNTAGAIRVRESYSLEHLLPPITRDIEAMLK